RRRPSPRTRRPSPSRLERPPRGPGSGVPARLGFAPRSPLAASVLVKERARAPAPALPLAADLLGSGRRPGPRHHPRHLRAVGPSPHRGGAVWVAEISAGGDAGRTPRRAAARGRRGGPVVAVGVGAARR